MESGNTVLPELPEPPAAEETGLPEVVDQVALARLYGEPLFAMPQDLYIPPDALEVILEAFEGPLDLLLYLIRRQNLDILDIPVAEITRQYVDYIEVMQEMRFELAAEYLVMAAILAEIKSRMLLPRAEMEAGEEGDPRAELVRRLSATEAFRPRCDRPASGPPPRPAHAGLAPPHPASCAALPRLRLGQREALLRRLGRGQARRPHLRTRRLLGHGECVDRILDDVLERPHQKTKAQQKQDQARSKPAGDTPLERFTRSRFVGRDARRRAGHPSHPDAGSEPAAPALRSGRGRVFDHGFRWRQHADVRRFRAEHHPALRGGADDPRTLPGRVPRPSAGRGRTR